METLRLAFSVRTLTIKSGIIQSKRVVLRARVRLQMYEREEGGEIQEAELAAILEIMLGVKEMELSGLFLSLDEDRAAITHGEIQSDRLNCSFRRPRFNKGITPTVSPPVLDELVRFIEQHPHFVQRYLIFKKQTRCHAGICRCERNVQSKKDE